MVILTQSSPSIIILIYILTVVFPLMCFKHVWLHINKLIVSLFISNKIKCISDLQPTRLSRDPCKYWVSWLSLKSKRKLRGLTTTCRVGKAFALLPTVVSFIVSVVQQFRRTGAVLFQSLEEHWELCSSGRLMTCVSFLLRSCYHQRVGGWVVKNWSTNAGDKGSIPLLEKSPGEENGHPLCYSYLGNPMVREAWQATVHGVPQRWTQLGDWTTIRTHSLWSMGLESSCSLGSWLPFKDFPLSVCHSCSCNSFFHCIIPFMQV